MTVVDVVIWAFVNAVVWYGVGWLVGKRRGVKEQRDEIARLRQTLDDYDDADKRFLESLGDDLDEFDGDLFDHDDFDRVIGDDDDDDEATPPRLN